MPTQREVGLALDASFPGHVFCHLAPQHRKNGTNLTIAIFISVSACAPVLSVSLSLLRIWSWLIVRFSLCSTAVSCNQTWQQPIADDCFDKNARIICGYSTSRSNKNSRYLSALTTPKPRHYSMTYLHFFPSENCSNILFTDPVSCSELIYTNEWYPFLYSNLRLLAHKSVLQLGPEF